MSSTFPIQLKEDPLSNFPRAFGKSISYTFFSTGLNKPYDASLLFSSGCSNEGSCLTWWFARGRIGNSKNWCHNFKSSSGGVDLIYCVDT